jgi:hypothetical protein
MVREGTYVHWLQESGEAPEPDEAHKRLILSGVASRAGNPSPAHLSRALPLTKK